VLEEGGEVKSQLHGEGHGSTKNVAKAMASANLLAAMLKARLLIDALPVAVNTVNIIFSVFLKFFLNLFLCTLRVVFLQEVVKKRKSRCASKAASATFASVVRQPLSLRMTRAEMALIAFRHETSEKMKANRPGEKELNSNSTIK